MTASLTGCRILLVQEDREILNQLSQLLAREGSYLLACQDGLEVTRLLDFAPPDLVLMDLILPGESGEALIPRIRATPAWQAVPVIVLSSRSAEAKIGRVFELGADDFLTKPYSAVELLARLRKRLRDSSERAARLAP